MTLKRGSRGENVKRLQEKVNVEVDGIFGKLTEGAVKAFQKANGLKADGIAGAKTLSALGLIKDVIIPCEDIKQFSSPHGNMVYGPDKSYSTYKSGGCGVAAFAIVVRAYGLAPGGETPTQTVQRLGRYSWEHGCRIKGNGTRAGLFKTNGLKYTCTKSADAIEAALRGGKLLILHIKKGFPNGYQGSGHFLTAFGIKGGDVLLRDVGSSAESRQRAALSKITSGLKAAYIMEVG